MDETPLGPVRVILERRLAEIRAEVAILRRPIHQAGAGDDARPQYGKRAGDHLSEVVQQRTNQAALDALLRTEQEVARALARIDVGVYGVCEACGGPVGAERLQALPWATLCITCKGRRESRRR